MICKECQKEGQQSTVTATAGVRTLMTINPYWDEAGRYHVHDVDTTYCYYVCSRGHEWTEAEGGSCWCGWRADE